MFSRTSSRGLPEVPVMVDGVQKWVTGLTPKTTCDDVIHSLLINLHVTSPHEAVFDYALFENWRGIERPLKGRSKFMKLWKDWGGETGKVQLTLRKIDSTVKNDIFGSVTKKKSKNWFKSLKDSSSKKRPATQQLFNPAKNSAIVHTQIQAQNNGMDMTNNMHEDSSMFMQNKENLFCAFTCYSKKKPSNASSGLKERDSNRLPFERPRSVQMHRDEPVECPRSSNIALNNNKGTYQDTITCIYSKEQYVSASQKGAQYTSTVAMRKPSNASVYGSTASLRKIDTHSVYGGSLRRDSSNSVYGSQASLKKDSIYGSSGMLRKDNVYGSSATLRKTDSVYGSNATLRKDNTYGSSATLRKTDSVYGSTNTLRKENIYGSTSKVRHSNSYKSSSKSIYQPLAEPIYSTAQEPVDHIYDYPHIQSLIPTQRNMPQNPVDWDYDYDNHIDYYSQSGSDTEEESEGIYENRFKSILNVVLHQEKRIQDQFRRIKEADAQIEEYEIKLHHVRSAEQGKDYLQDTYLRSDSPTSDVPTHEVNMYESLVEEMTSVDSKLQQQYDKIEEISTMIHNETHQLMNETAVTGPLESTRIDPAIQRQLDDLRVQLQDTVNMSVVHEDEIKEVSSSLHQYEHQLKIKEQLLAKLISELESDSSSSSINVVVPNTTSVDNTKKYIASTNVAEMGIDIGATPTKNIRSNVLTNTITRQMTPLSKRGDLTPVGTPSTSINAIMDYNNETVDLDALCNIGAGGIQRRFNNKQLFKKPSTPGRCNNDTDDIKCVSAPVTTIKNTNNSNNNNNNMSNSVTSLLPPLGFETMTRVFSSKLMPDFALSEPMDPKSTSAMESTINSLCMTHIDDTTLWDTQDEGIDFTFALPAHENTQNTHLENNTYITSPNKTCNTLLESTAHFDEASTINSSPMACKPPRQPTQPLNQKNRVKKKLFYDNFTCAEAVDREIKDIMSSLTGEESRLSESSESGVGSLTGDEHSTTNTSADSALSWTSTKSNFVETCV